ncbi:hypothetical protein BGZ65_005184 [Modicella reniformis]|uniref:C2H2-type domain-containing protein n=1 Tax=Modicella reniformis TaxID=1440133 RepID=A0A9P6MB73_9FUNG|nr:hypothetical protein BGZ65_005184 [Modicella reniformis]
MTDSAVHQQSKRLAGLSITNSSGNKVSILNDSPLDLDKASIKSEREYEKDTAASDEQESSGSSAAYRGLMVGHPGLPEGLLAGPSFSKRKYSCTHPGCNKRFTTSGHLARHNRIHTGERNFSCLMPGCPSKFSRQDNMMQHYRTHISPKSRRGASAKKLDPSDAENAAENGAEGDIGEQEQQSPSTGSSRFYPTEQEPESMDQDDHATFSTRDQHQHHAGPQQERNWSAPASPTSPMTRVVERMEDVMTTSSAPPSSSSSSSSASSLSSSSSSTSSQREQQLFYYRQQQQYQQQYQQRQLQKQQAASHASAYYHAAAATQSPNHHHGHHSHSHSSSHGNGSSKHMVSPPSSSSTSSAELHHPHTAYSYPHSLTNSSSAAMSGGNNISRGSGTGSASRNTAAMTPPSPQSTPVTPTKYRFDPIQDCLQQERRQREEATL